MTSSPRLRWLPLAAVALPPLVLAAIGLSHPSRLNLGTVDWWTTMHLLLVPLFPLLAVAVWVLLSGDRTPLAWAGRAATVLYIAFYTALDAISGIATGVLLQSTRDEGSEAIDALFATGSPLGRIGGYLFLAAVVAVLGAAWRAGSRGVLFWIAAAGLLVAGYLFPSSHIYWPKGVVTMLGFAIGFVLLELVRQRREVSRPASPR